MEQFSNTGRCEDGNLIGNCNLCGCNGVLVLEHKCKPVKMKQITFDVKLTFSEDLKGDVEIAEVQQHIMSALAYYADTHYLSPSESDANLVNVQIFEPLTQSMIAKEIN